MFSKKQMNINSIFYGNSKATDYSCGTDHIESCRGNSFGYEQNLSTQNYFIQSALEKFMKFDKYSKNFYENYCICDSQLQEFQNMKSTNQLVANSLINHNDYESISQNYAHNQTNLKDLFSSSTSQDFDVSKQYDYTSERFEAESKLKQFPYTEIVNFNTMKAREITQNNDYFQPQIPYYENRSVLPRRHVLGSKITKRNMKYFEELQNYNYLLETKVDAETGKQFTVYVCNHSCGCKKEFERPWNLLDHIRIHYDVRPYTCSYCNLRFIQKGNLNKHMMIHLKKNQENSTNNYSFTNQLNDNVRNIQILISNVII